MYMSKPKAVKTDLADLTNISPKNLLKLKQENITTIEEVSEFTSMELKTLLETTENKAGLIIAEARKNLPIFKSYSGLQLQELEKKQKYLKFNVKAVDDLFNGLGIKCGTVTEFYGAYASGKSQIGFTAIMPAILPEPYGLNGSALFIDTESTFDISRMKEIASFYTHILPMEEILNRIRVVRPKKSSDQIKTFKTLLENNSSASAKQLKLEKDITLVVVDSLTNHFRSQYLGRSLLAERQQRLSEHLRDLNQFACETNAAVLVINQVTDNPNPFSTLGSELAIGGNIVAHSTHTRIYLKKRKHYRVAAVADSASLPAKESLFKINKKGIVDIDEPDVYEKRDDMFEFDPAKYNLDENNEFIVQPIKQKEKNKTKTENILDEIEYEDYDPNIEDLVPDEDLIDQD